MTELLDRTVNKIPPIWTAVLVILAAVTGGWSARGTLSQQAGLPQALADHIEAATELEQQYAARLRTLEARQDALDRRQERIEQTLDRMLCYVQALAQETSVGACAR